MKRGRKPSGLTKKEIREIWMSKNKNYYRDWYAKNKERLKIKRCLS